MSFPRVQALGWRRNPTQSGKDRIKTPQRERTLFPRTVFPWTNVHKMGHRSCYLPSPPPNPFCSCGEKEAVRMLVNSSLSPKPDFYTSWFVCWPQLPYSSLLSLRAFHPSELSHRSLSCEISLTRSYPPPALAKRCHLHV